MCSDAAYKEKMKELSLVSLICSCLYPEARNKMMGEFEGRKWNSYEHFMLLASMYHKLVDETF